MRIDDYAKTARSTAFYPEAASFVYPVLGLAGEYGETLDEMFQGVGLKVPIKRSTLVAELGDVLWYVTNTALDLGFTMENLTDIVTGGLRCETFMDLAFQRLHPRDTRTAYLKATVYIGQLAEIAKKGIRDGYGKNLSVAKRAVAVTALAQLLVCLCEICEQNKICLGEVAEENNKKLTSRQARDKLQGDGNDR